MLLPLAFKVAICDLEESSLEVAICDFKFSSSSFKVANCDLGKSSLEVAFCDFKISSSAFKVANCDLESSASSLVSWNIKSAGKRSMLRLTCSLRRLVSTPYNLAKSRSRITCLPRMTWMRFSIFSQGCNGADSTFSMSFFFAINACSYITMLTILPGMTMIFFGVLPARYLAVSSWARTSFSTSSFGVSFGHSSVKRTLPLN